MKKLLLQLLLISVIFVFINVAFIALSTRYLRNNAVFKTNKNFEVFMFGHSHSECAYNDSLIEGVKNFSQSGEGYLYSYVKLKKLLEENKNIKTVFVEFSNNNIDQMMDLWNTEDSYRFAKYFPFFSRNELTTILKKRYAEIPGFFSVTLQENLNRIKSNQVNYSNEIGCYFPLKNGKKDSVLKAIKPSKSISEMNMKYLDEIIRYCRLKKINVFLIRSPLQKDYGMLENEQVFQQLLATRFENIDFIDLKNFPLLKSDFGDLEHLNYKGAGKLSLWLNELLKKGFLRSINKKEFIQDELNMFKPI